MNTWVLFLTRYVLVAAAGTALICVLVPAPRSRQVVSDSKPGTARAAKAHAPDSLQNLADDSRHFAGIVDRVILPDGGEANSAPSVSAPEPSVRIVEPPALENGFTPAQAAGAEPRWGVVSSPNTPYYSTAGSFLGHLPPGELLDVQAVKQNKSETLALCRPATALREPVILVKAADIDIRAGALDDVSFELRRLCSERAKILIELDIRARQRKNEVRGDNPYAAAFLKARNEQSTHWQKAKELQERMETSQGADRVHYVNELRKLKGQEIALRTNYTNAKERYDGWNQSHPQKEASEPAHDPLAEELLRIDRQLEALVASEQ